MSARAVCAPAGCTHRDTGRDDASARTLRHESPDTRHAVAWRRWFGALPLLAGGCAALVGAVLWLLCTIAPLVTFQRCVSPDPRLAWIGVHLTVLRADPGCNSGQLALNTGPGHAVGLVVMVAVPVLVANLLTALGAIGFWVAARRLVARIADAVRRVWPRLPEAPHTIALGGARPLAPRGQRPIRGWQLDRSPVLRRGPPVACAS